MNSRIVTFPKWISRLLTIAVLLLSLDLAQAQTDPYGSVLSKLWAQGSQLQDQGDYAGAQKVYEEALQVSQQLPDSLVQRCAIAFSRVGLESMIAVQKTIREQGTDPEGVEITLIQQGYATWETVGAELNLRSADCP